jgi:transcriptional regulator GlxA family with amidase domain
VQEEGTPAHRLAVVLYPHVAATDITGPMEAFGLANFISRRRHYDLMTITLDGNPVPVAGSYLTLCPTHSFDTLPDRIDTLLVAGGPAAKAEGANSDLIDRLRALAPRCDRFGSVCNGTFILCATGITNGKRVATHWHYVDELARMYPKTTVDGDAVFLRSGDIWTSAGMTTGIDLALAMIEADLGRKLALEVARHMVLYLKREGGQSQFSMHLKAQFADAPSVERLQHHILNNLSRPLPIEELALIARLSTRSLQRTFRQETGRSVGAYISGERLRLACGLLEGTGKGFKEIAALAGFGTDSNMRKVFMRELGITPSTYRARFQIEPVHGLQETTLPPTAAWRHDTRV